MEVLEGRGELITHEGTKKGKLWGKLAMSSRVLPAREEKPIRQLDVLIQKCKEGRLEAFIEAVEQCESQDSEVGLEDDHYVHEADKSDSEGWTCYHYAAFKGLHRIIGFLNSKGFNPNRESKEGWTPLLLAAYQSKLESVRELLKHPNIQINRVTWRGTALHQACHSNSDHIVQLLLDSGACMTQEDSNGRIALQVASKLSIIEMIPRYMGQRQLKSITHEAMEAAEIHQVPPPFCGEVHYAAPLKINDTPVYLVLDTGAGELSRFMSQREFLGNGEEAERVQLLDIQAVTQVEGPVGTKGKIAFMVESLYSKAKYISRFPELAEEWVERIRAAVEYCQVNKVVTKNGRPSSFTFRTLKGSVSLDGEESKKGKKSGNSSGAAVSEDETISVSGGLRTIEEHVSFKSFHIIEELGSGSFGKVYKVRKISDNHIYAMKSLSKQYLARHKQLKYAISECRILKGLKHSYVIRLFHAFQTPRNLYMVLEYCPNGDLSAHLTERRCFDESEARIYIAETLLAIDYLHAQDIVYRDLKPENILLDFHGHVRLADFGLAKEGISSGNVTKTFCGSPAYFAPEVINRRGAGKPADIYGLGAILYEMLTGQPPFYSEDSRELMSNIQKQGKLTFPKGVSEDAKDIVRITLHRDANKRPTSSQLKSHPFFRKIDWSELQEMKVSPPILGAGWKQGEGDLSEEEETIYPLEKVDKDYSETVSMEECVLDFH